MSEPASLEQKLTERWTEVLAEAQADVELATYHLGRIASAYGNQMRLELDYE